MHLHGSVKGDPRGIVLTDKDFGEAYLSNGWATRFLVPMFRRYVVLFIGYSYGDLIMRYLTRGLSSGVRCYTMIDDKKTDADSWRTLGVTPIGYPVNGEDHGALVKALRGWNELARMRQPEYCKKTTEIVKKGPKSLNFVCRDYLLRQLATVRGVEHFDASCRLLEKSCEKNSWLRWIETEVPNFSKAFRGEPVDEATKRLLQWYAETFIADPELHGAALQTVQRMGQRFNDDLFKYACSEVLMLEKQDKAAGARWKVFLLTSVGRPTMMPYDGPLPHDPSAVVECMIALTEVLRPQLTLYSYSDYSDEDLSFPLCKPKWSIDESSLSNHLQSMINQTESGDLELESALEGALLSVYQLMDVYHNDKIYKLPDELFIFSIKPLKNLSCPHGVFYTLVDALRDYGVKALNSVGEPIGRWWSFNRSLFQRLAVHLITESSRTADDKINWVLDHDALYMPALKPEVLRLLMESVAQASSQVQNMLLARIKNGSLGVIVSKQRCLWQGVRVETTVDQDGQGGDREGPGPGLLVAADR